MSAFKHFTMIECWHQCILQLSRENECEGLLPDCIGSAWKRASTTYFLLLRVCCEALSVFYSLTKCTSLQDGQDSNAKAGIKHYIAMNKACVHYYTACITSPSYIYCFSWTMTEPKVCCRLVGVSSAILSHPLAIVYATAHWYVVLVLYYTCRFVCEENHI